MRKGKNCINVTSSGVAGPGRMEEAEPKNLGRSTTGNNQNKISDYDEIR